MENIIYFLALIIAITIHEFSHAFVADRLGDPTARSQGRLSLNPLVHADLFGTIIFPLLSALTGLPTIGWAKPVPIDPYNFRNPKKDEILVSLAGPASNLLLAVIFAIFLHFSPYHALNTIYFILIVINVSLAIFNLIPIPPLDGSHLLLNLLPEESSQQWREAFEKYGFIILLVVLFLPFGGSNILNIIMSPIINLILRLLIP